MEHEKYGEPCNDESCWCRTVKKAGKKIDFSADEWNDSVDAAPYWKWDDRYAVWKKENISVSDIINEPAHYKLMDGSVESIDLIRDVLTREEYLGYLRGTLIAYHLRANRKNGEEDLRKADIYNNWLIEALDDSS